MKSIFVFSTRFRVFWTELPLIFLLTISIIFNSKVDSPTRLYPLIIALSIGILFIFIYFFRGVKVSLEELRMVGRFSDRFHSVISDENTLLITAGKKRRLKIELFGKNDAETKTYDWISDEDLEEINLFRAKAYGTDKTVKKILTYFGANSENAKKATENADFSFETPLAFFNIRTNEDGKEYEIKMKKLNSLKNGDEAN